MKQLLAEDTDEAFVALTRLLRGARPDDNVKQALIALATEEVPAEHLVRAIVRGTAGGRRYEEHAAPPYNYRSRMAVQDLMGAAGKRKLEAARPPLVALLTHPDLSTWAAHALAEFRDAETEVTALRLMPSLQGTARSVMIGVILSADATNASDKLSPWFDDPGFVRDLLYVLWRDLVDKKRASRQDEAFARDERFIALAARTRDSTKDRELAAMLKDLLAAVSPALAAMKPKRVRRRRPTPALLDRARDAATLILPRLRDVIRALEQSGYRFLAVPHTPPGRSTKTEIAKLERAAGALPATVRAFCEIVGAIDLRGSHRAWALSSARSRRGASAGLPVPDPLPV